MRLEIRPFPTQRQRKEIKGLPQVSGVETDGDQAWVTHEDWPEKECIVVEGLRYLGFSVKGYGLNIEARTASRARLMKKKKKRSRRVGTGGGSCTLKKHGFGPCAYAGSATPAFQDGSHGGI